MNNQKHPLPTDALYEITSPVVPVLDEILVLPLIGVLDSRRTQQVMENLLNSIIDQRARVVIVDITGVPVVDTLTASHLINTAKAVHLMGAAFIVTGISPKVAQTLVELGVELTGFKTFGLMSEGVVHALELLKKKIVPINRETS